MKITFNFLLESQVVAIRRKLKDWTKPLLEIKEEIYLPDWPRKVWLVAEDGIRVQFDREYIKRLKLTFKNVDWYLTQPSKKDPNQKLLVGILPQNHYILLAPRREVA